MNLNCSLEGIEIYDSGVVGGEPYDYVPLRQHIVWAANVCGGRPTFKYMRIEVAGGFGGLDHGQEVIVGHGSVLSGCIVTPSIQDGTSGVKSNDLLPAPFPIGSVCQKCSPE